MKILEEQWYKFDKDDAEFNIRPYPFSNYKFGVDLTIEFLWDQFDYCLVGWKGLKDSDDKPIAFNDKNKKKVFDYYITIRDFVNNKAADAADIELKN